MWLRQTSTKTGSLTSTDYINTLEAIADLTDELLRYPHQRGRAFLEDLLIAYLNKVERYRMDELYGDS